jgi:hypothetical protein
MAPDRTILHIVGKKISGGADPDPLQSKGR